MSGSDDAEQERFWHDVRRVRAGDLVEAPTSPAEVTFATALVGSVDHLALARTIAPTETGEPGWWLPAVDLALGRAAMQLASEHQTCVTVGFSLELSRPDLPPGERLDVLGRRISTDGDLTSTAVEARDASGRLVLHGVGRFLMVTGVRPSASEPDADPRPRVDLAATLGLVDTATAPDASSASLTLTPTAALANPSGVVHGGVQAAALAHAMARLVGREATTPPRLLSLSVDYQGPVPVDAGPVEVVARVRRLGAAIGVVDAHVVTATGRVGTVARGTFGVGAGPA